MIFHKSLSKKKGAAYSFFSGLSASFVPSVLIFIFLTFFMAVCPLINFIDAVNGNFDDMSAVRKTFKFFVFEILDEGITLYFILGIMGILAIFTAVRIFSFICDKRTVNVYYSLGIKRSVLFISKYFSGALLLCCATAAAVILSYIVNLIFTGASWQLSLVLIHLYCGLSVFLLICYSIAAAVFSSVGTVSEAVVYSAAVLFAPTIVIFITENIIAAFLPSSTLNMYFHYFNDFSYHYSNNEASLLEATAAYNPLLFFADELVKYSRADIEKGEILLTYADSGWTFPNLLLHLPWFIIAIAAGAVGALLFRRIKAENCGFLNTNKLLSNLTIFELCLFGSCILLSEIKWNGVAVTLGIGAAAAFGLYIIAEVFLKRSFIKILKSLYKFVAHMAVIAVIFTICATGAFGYGEYIPDVSKIESVQIALPLSYSQITTQDSSTGWMSDGFVRIYDMYRPCFMPEMTDSEDISTVVELNRRLNQIEKDDDIGGQIIIRYNLKSGGYSERRHLLTSEEEARLMLGIFDTKAYKAELKGLFTEPFTADDVIAEQNRNGWVDEAIIKKLAFDYEYSLVTARAASLQEHKILDLTKEDFALLKDAVYKDLSALTAEEYFTASYRQIGVLSFGTNDKAQTIEGVNGYSSQYIFYDEEVSSPVVSEPVTDVPADEIFPEDYPTEEMPEEMPEDSPYLYEEYYSYNSLGGLDYNSDYDVIITENMKNTLSALEKLGMSDCFGGSMEIECVAFREYNVKDLLGIDDTSEIVQEFFAYPTSSDSIGYIYDGESASLEDMFAENKITDKQKITELESLMKLHAYTFNSGYLCLIKYKDNQTYTVRYLSESDAPDYVRNYSYQMQSNSLYYW